MFEVIQPGLETSIQDYPGRIGYWNQGFPPSGPMDSWSFRLGNLLVGNPAGAAGLECQYMGPTLKFQRDGVIAVTGADMQAKLDGQPVPLWESIAVKSGQTLAMGPAKSGVRAYVTIAGGIDTPPWLGSRSTFHKAGVGGMEGRALKPKQVVPVATGIKGTVGKKVKPEARPQFATDKRWEIEVVPGPNDDWIDAAGQQRFLTSDWKLSSKSDRTGFRLEGPQWTFTEKAYKKAPEHGSEPSNIIDHGYPLGAINLAGQTPIILVNDGPSMGGFINPYTVPSAAFWKLGQSKPGDIYRFKAVTVDQAQELRKKLNAICTAASIA
ncbi:MAG TPA: biotin-dependent carboxyltransferase family protein [Hypericibacter adhaerens]|jgi:urea carboxylase|uniref:5-oxoprolinase subunit C family protein n=1 Tax=Hypericibacter adhaerens TaxID=2602016 RepID=UPI002BCA1DAF|nr:biotin-dependent carboxyltransferase family protein [Hypericibacter adhaerens]HWA45321.1 biotin-dependent carboxyltransferase family protein [Hypericibacter adhaerens]